MIYSEGGVSKEGEGEVRRRQKVKGRGGEGGEC